MAVWLSLRAGLMLIAALIPFLWFRRKGWL